MGFDASAGDRGGDRMRDYEIIMVILTVIGLLIAVHRRKDRT